MRSPANRLPLRPADAERMVSPPLIPPIGVCGRAPPDCLRPPIFPPGAGKGGRHRQAVRLSLSLLTQRGRKRVECVVWHLVVCPLLTRLGRLGLRSQTQPPLSKPFHPQADCTSLLYHVLAGSQAPFDDRRRTIDHGLRVRAVGAPARGRVGGSRHCASVPVCTQVLWLSMRFPGINCRGSLGGLVGAVAGTVDLAGLPGLARGSRMQRRARARENG